MNIDQIKKEFPIFDNKVQNNDLVYLDSANSSQKPRIVIDRIYDFCLLYTSPSPRDMTGSRMPSSA